MKLRLLGDDLRNFNYPPIQLSDLRGVPTGDRACCRAAIHGAACLRRFTSDGKPVRPDDPPFLSQGHRLDLQPPGYRDDPGAYGYGGTHTASGDTGADERLVRNGR